MGEEDDNIMNVKWITFIATTNRGLEVRDPVSKWYGYEANKNSKTLIEQTDAFAAAFGNENKDDSLLSGKSSSEKVPSSSIQVIHESANSHVQQVLPSSTGLVGAVTTAYNTHTNLELRPDDIWIAILCQFSAYVNGRAEELRHKFVDHDGQKELVVRDFGDIYTADYGRMTRAMLDEITKNIKDPSLRDWFLPGFTTSTQTDDVCAAATAMCSFQKYFKYLFELSCGIPQVTLLGTLQDWELLRNKIDRLLEFDTDEKLMAKWVDWLREICDNFVESRQHGSKNNLESFWDRIAHHRGGGSGPRYISGWIAVFSFFDEDGKVAATTNISNGSIIEMSEEELKMFYVDTGRWSQDEFKRVLKDKAVGEEIVSRWPIINTNQLNHNVVSCPVDIDDNGRSYKSRLFVGQMGFESKQVSNEDQAIVKESGIVTAGELKRVKPRNDWALVVYKE